MSIKLITYQSDKEMRLRLIIALLALFLAASPALAEVEMSLDSTAQSKRDAAKAAGLEARMMWFDATANLERLSTREGVCRVLDNCVKANLNAVAVGVKTSCGFALYNSKIAPKMRKFQGRFTYPEGYDLLKTVVEEGHKRGLRVYAMLMVFSEGRMSDRSGPAYTKFPKWQSVFYDLGPDGKPGIFPASRAANGTFVFVNPALPEVRRYELSIIEEIAKNYDIDGLILDRCRWDDVRADFSKTSRKAFEHYLAQKVMHFPQDICRFQKTGGKYTRVPGPLYKEWLEWRASVITEFVTGAAAKVRSIKPHAAFASVVGAWYPEYSSEGVNWASKYYHPETRFTWATPGYYKTGYAECLDFLVPNCYGKTITQDEPRDSNTPYWWTIEGGARVAYEVTNDTCYIYAGVYVENFRNDPDRFRTAVRTALQESNGVKIFDLSQIEDYGWWPLLEKIFQSPAKLPHERQKSP